MVKFYLLLVILILTTGLSKAQVVDSSDNMMVTFIEDSPYYKGDLKKFIQNKIHYPESAKIDSIQGKVFVSFWIDTTGNAIDCKVIRGIRKDLNKEALRVAKLIKFEKPAMQRGKPVKVKYVIPIEFKLNDKKK